MSRNYFKNKETVWGGKHNTGVKSSELWLECAKLGIADQPDIKTALQQLSINPKDVDCATYIKGKLRAVAIREILDPEPFRRTNPTSAQRVSGAILLGKVRHSGISWGINPDALTEHLICLGRTGGGKTTIIKKILQGILKRRK